MQDDKADSIRVTVAEALGDCAADPPLADEPSDVDALEHAAKTTMAGNTTAASFIRLPLMSATKIAVGRRLRRSVTPLPAC
jgi:hypothetical protein